MTRTALLPVALLFLIATPATTRAQTSVFQTADVQGHPPVLLAQPAPTSLSASRKLGQVAAGAAAGTALSMAGGYAGYVLSGCDGSGDEFLCGFGGMFVGITAGHVLGSAIAVHAVGRTPESTGRLGLTLLGGLAGFGASVLVITEDIPGYIAVPVLILGTSVGAVLGNNADRRLRSPVQASGLVNLDRGGFYLGVPALGATRLADPARTSARSVRLLTASW